MSEGANLPERRYPAQQPWRLKANRPVIVFVTVCVKDRRHLLASDVAHRMLLDAWARADRWLVGSYVILPDHLHLFASPVDIESPDVKRWVAYWKSVVSRNWVRSKDKPIWQRDGWDRQLRSGDSYRDQWSYVRNNPVRHRLVDSAEDWPYQGTMNELSWFG